MDDINYTFYAVRRNVYPKRLRPKFGKRIAEHCRCCEAGIPVVIPEGEVPFAYHLGGFRCMRLPDMEVIEPAPRPA